MLNFNVIILAAVVSYFAGDVLLSRGDRTESEALRRGGVMLIATAFGLLAALAVEVTTP